MRLDTHSAFYQLQPSKQMINYPLLTLFQSKMILAQLYSYLLHISTVIKMNATDWMLLCHHTALTHDSTSPSLTELYQLVWDSKLCPTSLSTLLPALLPQKDTNFQHALIDLALNVWNFFKNRLTKSSYCVPSTTKVDRCRQCQRQYFYSRLQQARKDWSTQLS